MLNAHKVILKKTLTGGGKLFLLALAAVILLASCRNYILVPTGSGNSEASDYIVDDNGRIWEISYDGSDTFTQTDTKWYLATPETAQEMLDKVQSGENIYFSAGTYADTYYLRATRTTATAYDQGRDDSYNNKIEESRQVAIEDLTINGRYHYVREMSDIEFRADKNAVFTGIFKVENEYSPSSYDPVRQIIIDNSSFTSGYSVGYGNHVRINGLVFDGFTFKRDSRDASFKALYLYRDLAKEDKITNLVFRNCSFTGTDTTQNSDGLTDDQKNEGGYDGQRAVFLHANTEDAFNDIKLINCTFSTIFQGIYGCQINGFTAEDCSFDNIGHNSIALQNYQSGELQYSKGNITITGNEFSNSDTPIGRGGFKDADILISGNVFSGIKDDSIVKFGAGGTHQKLYNVTVTFKNNTYENTAISDSTTDTGSQKDSIVIDYAGLVTVS